MHLLRCTPPPDHGPERAQGAVPQTGQSLLQAEMMLVRGPVFAEITTAGASSETGACPPPPPNLSDVGCVAESNRPAK